MLVITPFKTAKECFDTLTNLYERKAPNQKRVPKNKLRTLKLEKGEGVAYFFTYISQVRDQLLAIGVTVDDDDLVQTVVDGLPSSWETFLSIVNGCEVQPNFEILWNDCLQEEGRMQRINGSSKEGNLALVAKTRKSKKFFHQKNKDTNPQGKHIDWSKMKCFNCQKMGH